MGNTLTAIEYYFCCHDNTLFHCPHSKNIKQGHKLELIYLCLLDHAYEEPFANMKMECQRWPQMPLILWRSGIQYVAMITNLSNSNYEAHLVEIHCKESNISDTNWRRYLFSSYLIKIWLSVSREFMTSSLG